MTFTLATRPPKALNRSPSSSSVTLGAKLPTKTFVVAGSVSPPMGRLRAPAPLAEPMPAPALLLLLPLPPGPASPPEEPW